ncbi:MAG: extracellular solute-binding protein, partial [Rhodospirillales bacterium]|nr:extracellular solute-binding protein [Rhodospirillales bacterium]
PQGGDTDQIRGVAAGAGDVAIANHYYYARLMASKKPRDKEVVAKVKVFWPNQNGRGTHVNISGAGITKSARHKAAAIKLLEFLASEPAQKIYAEKGFEFPVRRGVAASSVVSSLGTFKSDDIKIDILGKNNAAAVRIFDRAGWR